MTDPLPDPTTPEPMRRQTLSVDQACQHVGVSRRTIYNWIRDHKVQFVQTAGGAKRIYADSLWRNTSTGDVA